MNKFTIGSGYFHGPDGKQWASWFFDLWQGSVLRQNPHEVVIVGNGGCVLPGMAELAPGQVIALTGNLGHVHSLIGKSLPAKPHAFCGWSGAVLSTALLAYCNETDYVWAEQDMLMFGPVVERMYEELGPRKMLFGKSNTMPCAQSLFLIKHDFIPRFVHAYLSFQDDRSPYNLPEHKFRSLLQMFPREVGQFSFGVDRDRPLPIGTSGRVGASSCWYGQKFSPGELKSLAISGMLDLDQSTIPDVKVFSNDAEDL